jgi:hypothetical protein
MDELEKKSLRLMVMNKCSLPSSGLELKLEFSMDAKPSAHWGQIGQLVILVRARASRRG